MKKTVYMPILVFAFALLACRVQSVEEITGLLGTATPVPTQTPQGDVLVLTTNTFTATLGEGEQIPGTGLQYVAANENGYSVLINGRPAVKKILDSFQWDGGIARNVVADYRLRIAGATVNGLTTAGTVRISVLSPEPIELDLNASPPPTDLNFSRIEIDYRVPVGSTIPGTTVTYIGLSENGLGELAGITQYPFISQGDSFTWYGTVRDNVHLRYNLRAISVTDEELHLAGGFGVVTAEGGELWIYP